MGKLDERQSYAEPSHAADEAAAKTGDAQPRWNLDAVVSDLRLSREVTHNIRHGERIRRAPSREAVARIVDDVTAAMFPTHYGQPELGPQSIDYFVGSTLNAALVLLAEQTRRALSFTLGGEPSEAEMQHAALALVRDFAAGLPAVRGLLVSDLRAAFQGDPAATNYPEILLGYAGMRAIISYRLAHALHRLGATLVARLVSNIAHSTTGIDIHPGAEIGSSFFIDHGTGVVVGETAIIGQRVRLYQGVTLGARDFPADDSGALVKGKARHPIVEDDVVIYAGATILGRITIGRGSTVGGNVWLTRNVPPGSRVTQARTRSDDADWVI